MNRTKTLTNLDPYWSENAMWLLFRITWTIALKQQTQRTFRQTSQLLSKKHFVGASFDEFSNDISPACMKML